MMGEKKTPEIFFAASLKDHLESSEHPSAEKSIGLNNLSFQVHPN